MREVTWLDLVAVASVIVIFFVPIVANWNFPDSPFVDRFLKNFGVLVYYATAYGGLVWIERKLKRVGLPRRNSFWRSPVCKKK